MIEIVMNHDLCRECEDVSFGHAPRCCLLCLLIVARGGTFMLEQPGGSYMEYYDKMIWLYSQVPVFWHQQFSLFVTPSPPVINCTIGNIVLLSWFSHAHGSNHFLAQVFKICWWMAHYGSTSPKRHKAFCNNKAAGRYNRGKLQLKKFREQQREESKPTARYVDSKGRKRYHGLAGKLKSTQTLCFQNTFGWAERGAATSHLQNWLESRSGTIWNVIVAIYFGIIQELSYQTYFAAINFKKKTKYLLQLSNNPTRTNLGCHPWEL